MISKILLIGLVFFCDAIFIDDIVEWNLYKHKYSKHYASFEDDLHHMVIWLEHKHQIEEHNQQYENGIESFRMGFNEYSDVKHEDFVTQMNGYKSSSKDEAEMDAESLDFEIPYHGPLPASIDWRLKGAVTEVKNQGVCGSCWSFAATGAIEGQHFRKTGQLLSFSEQNLVDCSTSNNGCDGGLTTKAYKFVKYHGIRTEKAYPYTATEGHCKYHGNSNHSIARVRDFVRIPPGDENKIIEALAFVGPVAVSIDATGPKFHHYEGGIYHNHYCSSSFTDHAVLIVGYGTDEHQRDYYIGKNSWGPSWGENGYFRLARNHHNHCGIAKRASYPIV